MFKRVSRAWQFLIATGIATLHCFENSPIEGWRKVFRAARVILNPVAADSANAVPRYRRCLRCPLFNRKRRTCGTYGVCDDKGQQMGCLCYMPLKVRYQASICWLDENTDGSLPYGWHEQ